MDVEKILKDIMQKYPDFRINVGEEKKPLQNIIIKRLPKGCIVIEDTSQVGKNNLPTSMTLSKNISDKKILAALKDFLKFISKGEG